MEKSTANNENLNSIYTAGFLEREEEVLGFLDFGLAEAVKLGEISVEFGMRRRLPIAIEVRIGDWTVFHASLPGSSPENDWWMNRKARVVVKTGHSSLYERVLAEETGVDWFAQHGVSEEDYAIHGGGLPINVKGKGLVGVLLISGLPQVQDHLLGVEILTEFLARKGETD